MLYSICEEGRNIPEKFFEYINTWLTDRVFSKKNMLIELKLSFLQFLMLALDIPDCFKYISEKLCEFLNDSITKVHEYQIKDTSNYHQ